MTPDILSSQNVRNMSDLYLELRTRIPVVADQTVLGTQRIADAQRNAGLSNEAVARLVPVSEKTWRRWKKLGRIPTSSLPAVARALRLELRELAPQADPNVVDLAEARANRDLRDHIDAQHDQVMARLDRIEELARSAAIAAASLIDR